MTKTIVCLLFLVFQVKTSWQTQTYKAAVVEYYPIQNRSASIEEITSGNVGEYLKLLDSVKDQNLDLIVFPEATITYGAFAPKREDYLRLSSLVPNVTDEVVPCTTENELFSDYFKRLSCAAVSANTYLVANLMEKSQCVGTICSQDRWNLYNTDVAFDRTGKVVARYRKFNLFGEYPLNSTEEADITTFKTDFDVTFGMFTCFDLLFETPALKLVRQGVKHIIFPTMWFSELPFLSALQAQNMWAVENDVVFLSAGANNPTVGSGGTGIFLGRLGALDVDIIGQGGSKVYVKSIPKTRNQQEAGETYTTGYTNGKTDEIAATMDDFFFKLDDLSPYESEPLNLSKTVTDESVCHDDFCCKFKVKVETTFAEQEQTYYQYRMVAFSGVRHFDVMFGGVDVCGLVACTNSSIESCGTRFANYSEVTWPIKFKEITVTAKFTNENHIHQFPNTLLSSIRPLPSDAYQWTNRLSDNDTVIERTIKLVKSQGRLMTFGIFGRDVSRDTFSSTVALSCKNDVVCLIIMTILTRFLTQH